MHGREPSAFRGRSHTVGSQVVVVAANSAPQGTVFISAHESNELEHYFLTS